jgi:hypothetical protein
MLVVKRAHRSRRHVVVSYGTVVSPSGSKNIKAVKLQ